MAALLTKRKDGKILIYTEGAKRGLSLSEDVLMHQKVETAIKTAQMNNGYYRVEKSSDQDDLLNFMQDLGLVQRRNDTEWMVGAQLW